ncbi:MAG: hypothetical protein IJY31_07025, partial [Muribaculaceae bacterium]|nr:hypothetical protein [Muribaculaceae bacterium]
GAIAVESLDTQSARTIPNCHLIPRPEPGLAIGCDYTGGSPLPTRERCPLGRRGSLLSGPVESLDSHITSALPYNPLSRHRRQLPLHRRSNCRREPRRPYNIHSTTYPLSHSVTAPPRRRSNCRLIP